MNNIVNKHLFSVLCMLCNLTDCRIPGMTLVAERPHDKYGSAIFIRDDLKVKSISVTAANHVEVITAELPDVVVHSVYKPPSEQFVLPPLGNRSVPQIVI